MAFPTSFLRSILHWTLPDGEVAAVRTHWEPSSAIVSLDDATADAFEARAETYWADIKSHYAPATLFVGTTLQWIGTDGLVLATLDRTISGVAGTADAANLPTECALVVSLRTANAGRSGRGRMYLPALGTNEVLGDGRCTSGATDDISQASATYLGPLTIGAETYTAVVASTTKELLQPILFTRVGDVFDVQRRRRNQIAEVYAQDAV